jgi:hypothetical protein
MVFLLVLLSRLKLKESGYGWVTTPRTLKTSTICSYMFHDKYLLIVRALLLLDTEGLHDPEKGSRTHDTWIFTLAVLLSSVLIYNSKGTVDANALDGLYLATQLTEHVKVK